MLHLQTHRHGPGLQGLSCGQDRPLVVRAPRRAKSSRLATQVYVPDTTAVSTSGTTLANWTSTIPDILALGPRLTLGALSSLSDVQRDVDRLNRLLSDPRSFDAKRPELEALLTTYIQRGAGLESQILAAIGDALPSDWKSSLPLELQNALAGGTAPAVTTTPGDYTASSLAYAPETPTSPATLIDNRTAAELVDLREAVVGVRETLEDLGGSVPSDQIVVKELNAREKRDLLARKIRQLSPSTLSMQEANIISAVKEASTLLAEMDSALDL